MSSFIFTNGWETELHPSKDFGIKKIDFPAQWIHSLEERCLQELPHWMNTAEQTSCLDMELVGRHPQKREVLVRIPVRVSATRDHVGRQSLKIEGEVAMPPLTWEINANSSGSPCPPSISSRKWLLLVVAALLVLGGYGLAMYQNVAPCTANTPKMLTRDNNQREVARLIGTAMLGWLRPLLLKGHWRAPEFSSSEDPAHQALKDYLTKLYTLCEKLARVNQTSRRSWRQYYRQLRELKPLAKQHVKYFKKDCPVFLFNKVLTLRPKDYAWSLYQRWQQLSKTLPVLEPPINKDDLARADSSY